MRTLLTSLLILSLITGCGIKRNLQLPCEVKQHKTDDASVQSDTPTDNKPCVKQQSNNSDQPLPTSNTTGMMQKQ